MGQRQSPALPRLNEGGGQQVSETQARLLTLDQVTRLRPGEVLAPVGEMHPVRLRQRRYREDRALRGLWPAQIPPQGPPRIVP